MSRCASFWHKFESEGNFCGMDPTEISRVKSYLEFVAKLEKAGLEKDLIYTNFAVGAARPLISVSDDETRIKGLNYVAACLKRKEKVTAGELRSSIKVWLNNEANVCSLKPDTVKWKMVMLDEYWDYEVSSDGRVRRKKSGRELKPFELETGYTRVQLGDSVKDTKSFLIHRLVADAFIDNPDNKPYVNHKNGIRTDNRVENLEWVTAQENALDAVARRFENLENSKIKDQPEPEIKKETQIENLTDAISQLPQLSPDAPMSEKLKRDYLLLEMAQKEAALGFQTAANEKVVMNGGTVTLPPKYKITPEPMTEKEADDLILQVINRWFAPKSKELWDTILASGELSDSPARLFEAMVCRIGGE